MVQGLTHKLQATKRQDVQAFFSKVIEEYLVPYLGRKRQNGLWFTENDPLGSFSSLAISYFRVRRYIALRAVSFHTTVKWTAAYYAHRNLPALSSSQAYLFLFFISRDKYLSTDCLFFHSLTVLKWRSRRFAL